jgi:GNAT superfamily N-acetyltransferase
MELREVRLSDGLVVPLLSGLEEEYQRRYGSNDELRRAHVEEFDRPGGLFLVLVDGPITAAGGGFRSHSEGVCEVKRMWTNREYRRQGLAARILRALEEAAASAGYIRLVLETGPRQPEAAALYERHGYTRVPTYGHYPEALAFATDLEVKPESPKQALRISDQSGELLRGSEAGATPSGRFGPPSSGREQSS